MTRADKVGDMQPMSMILSLHKCNQLAKATSPQTAKCPSSSSEIQFKMSVGLTNFARWVLAYAVIHAKSLSTAISIAIGKPSFSNVRQTCDQPEKPPANNSTTLIRSVAWPRDLSSPKATTPALSVSVKMRPSDHFARTIRKFDVLEHTRSQSNWKPNHGHMYLSRFCDHKIHPSGDEDWKSLCIHMSHTC